MAVDREAAAVVVSAQPRALARSCSICCAEEAYYSRPIALRHPIVFYEGHLPGFSFNTLVKKGLGGPSIDARLETLFARGIDPHEVGRRQRRRTAARAWPDRDAVRAFADEADARVIDALPHADARSARPSAARSRRSRVHDPRARGDAPGDAALHVASPAVRREARGRTATPRVSRARRPPHEWIEIPAGRATLGVDRAAVPFGWDNEFPALHARTCRRSRSSATT